MLSSVFKHSACNNHNNLHVNWVRQEHPDSLPDGLVNNEQVDTLVTMHPSTMANNLKLEQEETAEQNGDISTNTSFISQESEPSNDDANSTSLSSSLSMTRKLTYIRVIRTYYSS